MKPSIQATKLEVRKDRRTLLRDVSFQVLPGTITGLIGPSGSGKTTLMRAIVGVQRISSGRLLIAGKPAGSRILRSRIGYMAQSSSIYTDLTVLQNLRYFATLTRATRRQVDDVIARVRLTDKKRQLVDTLSGGERARVSLAVALLGDPAILVLDEPTVGLDPLLRQELWQLFAELAGQGKTLVISSHVMDEAERCESLLLLRRGELLWADTKSKLFTATKTTNVETAFITMINRGKS